MNKKLEFYIDIKDFPETSNFYETLRSFLTDQEKIKMFYNLTHKSTFDLNDQSTADIMKKVSFGLAFQTEKLNLPNINFHMARHTFAYQARMKGFDIFFISKALGHSSLSVTEKYLQSFENDELTLKNKELIDGINESYII